MKSGFVGAVVATSIVLAGCSTTVAGTAVEDPSAAPRPDTGSYATKPRQVGPPDTQTALTLEGWRMAATAPLISDVDPTLRYGSQLVAGKLDSAQRGVRATFGAVAEAALKDREVGFFARAGTFRAGGNADLNARQRAATVGVIRMPSAAAATAAVTPTLRDKDTPTNPERTPVEIPGYPAAIGYTQDFKLKTSDPSNVAFLAYKQYVIVVYGQLSAEQVRSYFDMQSKGLDGFAPTPTEKLAQLPADEPGLAKYTVPPSGSDVSGGGSMSAKSALFLQSDLIGSKKNFDDAGVDDVGLGGNQVYRTRDAAAATRLREAFVTETTGAYEERTPVQVQGVPGSTCLTLSRFPGSDSRFTWCVVAVDRYLVEVSAGQQQQAVQALGASYLMIKGDQ
ncbi:hypothetical protein TTY48_24060 [Tsukamurella sp. TY48]|nr:hypothetical protein TTY48_24060 [Tsukamurella sp. TY48]